LLALDRHRSPHKRTEPTEEIPAENEVGNEDRIRCVVLTARATNHGNTNKTITPSVHERAPAMLTTKIVVVVNGLIREGWTAAPVN
jgi:hypothetical protein